MCTYSTSHFGLVTCVSGYWTEEVQQTVHGVPLSPIFGMEGKIFADLKHSRNPSSGVSVKKKKNKKKGKTPKPSSVPGLPKCPAQREDHGMG